MKKITKRMMHQRIEMKYNYTSGHTKKTQNYQKHTRPLIEDFFPPFYLPVLQFVGAGDDPRSCRFSQMMEQRLEKVFAEAQAKVFNANSRLSVQVQPCYSFITLLALCRRQFLLFCFSFWRCAVCCLGQLHCTQTDQNRLVCNVRSALIKVLPMIGAGLCPAAKGRV